jgi:tetratricopeptide (TPR) repeat protein
LEKEEIHSISLRVISWPTPQEYNEAVQNASLTFANAELKNGEPAVNALGLPRPITGAFASVYRIHGKHTDWAVRCFLRNIADQGERYGRLSEKLTSVQLPYMVPFQLIQQGILSHGQWYPLLKMEWVTGEHINDFVLRNLHNKHALQLLSEQWKAMLHQLNQHGIAHGDLQHGNVLVTNDGLKLVDYDGMYVPSLAGFASNEIGHRNYQHPGRKRKDFGPYLDNFAAWVIYVSLQCVSIDPSLWSQLEGGDECLLFRQRDFLAPLESKAFMLLENHQSKEVKTYARLLRYFLTLPLQDIPVLDNRPSEPLNLPPLKLEQKLSANIDSLPTPGKVTALPDWLLDEIGDTGNSENPFTFSRRAANLILGFSIGLIFLSILIHQGATVALELFVVILVVALFSASFSKRPPTELPRQHGLQIPFGLPKYDKSVLLANDAYEKRNYQAALDLYKKARFELAMSGLIISWADLEWRPMLAYIYGRLASCLLQLDRVNEAEPLLREALNSDTTISGEMSPEVGFDLNDLAIVLCYKGHLEEAKKILERSLSVLQSHFQPGDEQIAIVQRNLGACYLRSGSYTDAAKLLGSALESYQRNQVAEPAIIAQIESDLSLAQHGHLTQPSEMLPMKRV